jgi:kynurenine formamidase
MWGGVTAAAVDGRGAHRNDILPLANVMASRGVLLDLPEPGADALPPDHEATSSELERALERQRVELRSGDVLLIRTGHLGKTRRTGQWADYVEVDGVLPVEPGIGAESLAWLSDREVAAVACDNFGVEVMRGAETRRLPVHEVGLVYMGLFLGENFDLDLLADRCAGDGRWDFLLVAPALPIEGAVGGPVNPMAVR